LLRKPAGDRAHRVGSIIFNPGGPGGGGVGAQPTMYDHVPAQLRARFDVVTFDPRGIDGSDQLQCFASTRKEAELFAPLGPSGMAVTPREQAQAVRVLRTYAAACARRGGPIQDHMGTADVARDMDRLRRALGEAKFDYYGPSYGTYLGATYANLFPGRVGHLVLDGAASPVQWNDAARGRRMQTFGRIDSPRGTQTAMRLMLSECGKVGASRCAFTAGTPAATRAKYRTLLERVHRRPV
ncbi:alpha/beta fold hydrolase, partial [Nocardioides hankookensis]